MTDEKDYSLLRHNTFGIDAKCKRFIEYNTVEEAQQVAQMLTEADRPLLILGGGSNLLLTADYDGTVLHSGICFLEQIDECHVRCGSGYVWDDVVAYCVANGKKICPDVGVMIPAMIFAKVDLPPPLGPVIATK